MKPIRAAMAAHLFVLLMAAPAVVRAVSIEETYTCRTTMDDPCHRIGTCSIQGAEWSQEVTIDRRDRFDAQGWTGLCDMVHVALVQGNCEPPGSRTNLIVYLKEFSFAEVPSIAGPLACPGSIGSVAGVVPDGAVFAGQPLEITLSDRGDLNLTWGISCQPGDIDYAIYIGSFEGGFTSYSPLTCSTGGAMTWTFTPSPGSLFYLVVPHNGLSEGSYGFDGAGRSRGVSADACFPQDWSCP